MAFLRTLRKVVLGETWTVPVGVAIALVAARAADAIAGGQAWWRSGGGFLFLAVVVGVMLAAVGRPHRRR